MRGVRGLLLGLCSLALAGCATTPPSPAALANNDPYEQTNREMLKFNGKIDKYFVIPTVGLYFILVPEGGRRSVHNFLGNLSLPTIFVNDMLQGEFKRGSQTAGRFLVNSTIGFGGFLDPANRMKIPDHGEDFGQTLAIWGWKRSRYIEVPFLGPRTLRDLLGLAAEECARVDADLDEIGRASCRERVSSPV